MSEHRVSMLGASWRRFEDPTRSRDPRVRALVAALARVEGPTPHPGFRAELRAQLVAIAPRIVAEGREADATDDIVTTTDAEATRAAAKPTGARHADSWVARVRRIPIGRPLAVAASVITAFALLLGGAVWMSKNALPGDTLYGLKRASERVELATAGSDTAKAHDYLNFAANRADEVRSLLSRATASAAGRGPQAGGAVDPGTAKLITSTLGSADSDVRAASSLLGRHAVRTGSASSLRTMVTWAPSQLDRLNAINSAMPPGALQTRATASADLVSKALRRAQELADEIGCQCLKSSGHDSLGPRPCSGCTPTTVRHAPGSAIPQNPPRSGSSASEPSPAGASEAPGVKPHGSSTSTANAPPGGATSSPGAPIPSPPIRSLPITLPPIPLPPPVSTPPVTVGSCGLTISLGGIVVGVGACPSHS